MDNFENYLTLEEQQFVDRAEKIDQIELSSTERAVLNALHWVATKHGNCMARASFEKYAERTGYSVRRVLRIFESLAHRGLIFPEPAWWLKKITRGPVTCCVLPDLWPSNDPLEGEHHGSPDSASSPAD
jgi:hypothetical protein